MANPDHLAALRSGVESWNRWRAATNNAPVDLSGADLARAKLNNANLLRAVLTGADLRQAQMERAHLKGADLTGAVLERANLEHVNARDAIFDGVRAAEVNFEVGTLRGATFRNAQLSRARFHRAYLRDTDLSGAKLIGAWLRLAVLEGARCRDADFRGTDLRYASLVDCDLRGADLTDVHVYGVSAWDIRTDSDTRQDLIVSLGATAPEAPLRVSDLHTAQLLALMLDGPGVRRVLESASSKLVLILGSFSAREKSVLDSLRTALRSSGYVAVTFDFERPAALDYAETVSVLAGLSRFIVADYTDAKEVRAELLEARRQHARVPVIPLARHDARLPVTITNVFSADELNRLLVRYEDAEDLVSKLQSAVIEPAEARVAEIAFELERALIAARSL